MKSDDISSVAERPPSFTKEDKEFLLNSLTLKREALNRSLKKAVINSGYYNSLAEDINFLDHISIKVARL